MRAVWTSGKIYNGEHILKPPNEGTYSHKSYLKTKKKHLPIGTWNVRTLHQSGKLASLNLGSRQYRPRHNRMHGMLKELITYLSTQAKRSRHTYKKIIGKIYMWILDAQLKLRVKPFNIAILQT